MSCGGKPIRNGTLLNFSVGVEAELSSLSGVPQITNLAVTHLTFTGLPGNAGFGEGVRFLQVSSSTVSNCTFNSGNAGIVDSESNGDNAYNNNIFNKCRGPLIISVADDQSLILS